MRRLLTFAFLAACAAKAQSPAPTPEPAPDDLYNVGRQLFDEYAPPEVKEQYEFPSKQEWDAFAARLDHALKGDSLQELADMAPQARAALPALRAIPGYEAYADWLQAKLDEVEAAGDAVGRRATVTPSPLVPAPQARIPALELWRRRVRQRPLPPGSEQLMPTLVSSFESEGVPGQLAWIAEAESTLNPEARSPTGAAGLFQLMPSTAKAIGLSTFLPDERKDPAKSSRAAARYLRSLYQDFHDWPLAIAAYNAGEGRVRRALAGAHARDFASIAPSLPAETRMYVPKVCALVEARTGRNPEGLPAPRG